MYNALVKIRLRSLIFNILNSFNTKKTSKKTTIFKKIGIVLLVAFFALMLVVTIFSFFCFIAFIIKDENLEWFYFALTGIIAFVSSLIGNIFATQSQLYESKDNQIILSLPIPPRIILAARMTTLFLSNLFIIGIIMLLAIITYAILFPLSISIVVNSLIITIGIALVSLSFSCLFGWLLTIISSKFKNKSITQVITALLSLAVYFYIFKNDMFSITLDNIYNITTVITENYPIFYYFGLTFLGNINGMIFFILICITIFTSVYFLLSKTFITIITKKKQFKKVVYIKKDMKINSQIQTLIKKDMKHFFSSATYLINTCFGLILMIIGTVILFFYHEQFKSNISLITSISNSSNTSFYYLLGSVIIAIICFLISTAYISAPSISLESNNLWILKSLPIKPSIILFAKFKMHMYIVILPILLSTISIAFLFDFPIILKILSVLIPILFAMIIASLGLVFNLLLPRFNWLNETACVKESGSVLLTFVSSLLLIVGIIALYAFYLIQLIPLSYYLCIVSGLLVIINILLLLLLKNWGIKKFASL